MPTALKTILEEARKPANLDLSIPAVVGLVFGVLAVFGAIGFEKLSAAILLVLAAVSGSMLVNRHHAARLEVVADALLPSVRLEHEYPRSDLAKLFERATRISMLGISVVSLDEHRASLEDALGRGAQVDVLLCNPTEQIASWAAFRSHRNPEEDPALVQ